MRAAVLLVLLLGASRGLLVPQRPSALRPSGRRATATEPVAAEHVAHEKTPHKPVDNIQESAPDGLITTRKQLEENPVFGRLISYYLSTDDQKIVDGLSGLLKAALKDMKPQAHADMLEGPEEPTWDVS